MDSLKPFADWQTYSYSYLTQEGIKKFSTITALSIADARKTILQENVLTIVLRVWLPKPATPKQKLAQSYGFIMGSLKGAQKKYQNGTYSPLPVTVSTTERIVKAHALVDSQFAKLKRDITDLFRLAGLNIK